MNSSNKRRAALALGILLPIIFLAFTSIPLSGDDSGNESENPRNSVYAPRSRASPNDLAIDLKEAGVTRYYHLVQDHQFNNTGGGSSSWDSVGKFADAMSHHGLEMFIYLVPPKETSGPTSYLPFGHDYTAWAAAVSEMSLKHPAIQGMAIDDLGAATDLHPDGFFSPGYTQKVREALKSRNNNLRLFGVLYGQDFGNSYANFSRVRGGLDGIIYPYAGKGNFSGENLNTVDSSSVIETTRMLKRLTDCSGGSPCWNLSLSANSSSEERVSATVSAELEPGIHTVHFRVDHNLLSPSSGTFSLELETDDGVKAIPSYDSRQGIYTASMRLPRKSSSITLVMKSPATSGSVIAQVSGFSIDGSPADGKQSFSVSNPRSSTSEIAARIDLVLMLYAAKLGNEKGVDGASKEYFESVLQAGIRARSLGMVDEIVIYRPNHSGRRDSEFDADPRNWDTMQHYFSGGK